MLSPLGSLVVFHKFAAEAFSDTLQVPLRPTLSVSILQHLGLKVIKLKTYVVLFLLVEIGFYCLIAQQFEVAVLASHVMLDFKLNFLHPSLLLAPK